MTPETEYEKEAIIYGGQMGGEYLESIGKYNLSDLSKEEWQMFCQCVCLNFQFKKAENEIPY